MNLQFDFFKKEYEYTFINLGNFFTDLGGVGSVAEETLEGFGKILLILFFLDLVLVIKKKQKYDHTHHVIQFKERLPIYKQVIQAKMTGNDDQDLADDLVQVNKLIEIIEKEKEKQQQLEQNEGGESSESPKE